MSSYEEDNLTFNVRMSLIASIISVLATLFVYLMVWYVHGWTKEFGWGEFLFCLVPTVLSFFFLYVMFKQRDKRKKYRLKYEKH